MIGPVLAPALDCHTREGRLALSRFAEVPKIAKCLAQIHEAAKRAAALWAATFIAEGARVDLRVSSEPLKTIRFDAADIELGYHGLTALEHRCALL